MGRRPNSMRGSLVSPPPAGWRARRRDFWSRVLKVGNGAGCWEWIGKRRKIKRGDGSIVDGYGIYSYTDLSVDPNPVVGAHRVAWTKTYGLIPSGMSVLHRCDNPPCCRPDHLFLGTLPDNMKDKVSKGRQSRGPRHAAATRRGGGSPSGSSHRLAKITEADVIEIRRMYASGSLQQAIGLRFGITQRSVSNIIRRKTWRHV